MGPRLIFADASTNFDFAVAVWSGYDIAGPTANVGAAQVMACMFDLCQSRQSDRC